MDEGESIEIQQHALTAGALPAQIKVMPVILVPKGQAAPTQADKDFLRDHLAWAQRRYKEMLKNRDTFQIAGTPVVVNDTNDLSFWNKDGVAADVHRVMLAKFGYNRFNNPYIYVVAPVGVMVTAWAEAMNGGINTGGGSVYLGGWDSNRASGPHQSMLQHELVHAFGIVHSFQSSYPDPGVRCDSDPTTWNPRCTPFPTPLVCRFSAKQGWSVSSYDNCLDTSGWTASQNPGIILPEELAALSLNKRVFPKLYFDPETDLLSGTTGVYRMGDNPGVASIAGQVEAKLTVTTSSGELFNSKVANIARNPIQRSPSRPVSIRQSNPTVGYDSYSMWHSSPSPNGWVSVQVQFPMAVSLNKIGVHTEHSGAHWSADVVKVEAGNPFAYVTQQGVGIDDQVSFSTTTASRWQFSFHSRSGNNGYVVVRGLQFFGPDGEIFSNFYPTELYNYPVVTTASGEGWDSKVSHAVTGWPTPANDAQTGYQPTLMWHSNYSADGWVSVDVTFPYPVTVNGVEVHSQYGGQAHMAQYAQILYDRAGTFVAITQGATNGPDATYSFSQVKSSRFRVKLQGLSGYVVLRKLLFKSPVSNGYLERPDCIKGPQVLPPY
jgi:hypothetical protein